MKYPKMTNFSPHPPLGWQPHLRYLVSIGSRLHGIPYIWDRCIDSKHPPSSSCRAGIKLSVCHTRCMNKRKKLASGAVQMSCPHIEERVRVPGVFDEVHKDECTQCFATAEGEGGIFVCLTCFNGGCGVGAEHAQQHFKATGGQHAVAVRLVKEEIPLSELEQTAAAAAAAAAEGGAEGEPEAAKEVTKLAIGKDGGFSNSIAPKQYRTKTSVRCLACEVELDASDAKSKVFQAVQGVLNAKSAADIPDEDAAWEVKLAACEHGLTLQQVENAPILNQSELKKCQDCDIEEGLWLCLTCGAFGCGRAQKFSNVSGNGHAKAHYAATGHPMVLKVGTITPQGTADIYCYACDNEVLDEHLVQHMAAFQIDVATQEKFTASLDELNIKANQDAAIWSRQLDGGVEQEVRVSLCVCVCVCVCVCEEEYFSDILRYMCVCVLSQLKFGPGFCGLSNLGSTCYISSVLQVLLRVPSFQKQYVEGAQAHIASCTNARPAKCFECQMCKIGDAIFSGKHSAQPSDEVMAELERSRQATAAQGEQVNTSPTQYKAVQPGIPPRLLKKLVAKEHPEFKGGRQQVCVCTCVRVCVCVYVCVYVCVCVYFWWRESTRSSKGVGSRCVCVSVRVSVVYDGVCIYPYASSPLPLLSFSRVHAGCRRVPGLLHPRSRQV
jgi:ubiquitin carboxyl-terminal hydrolase 5/13